MIPWRDDVLLDQRFQTREIGDHALFGVTLDSHNIAADSDFNCIAVAVQVAALTLVIGYAVASVEFKPAGDAHREAGADAGKRKL